MALGVLNNLSAIYAEHNLNNTSNSLQSVLQQLSSGSRINSGADDSAGLSLVNGLMANSTALSQSVTNATEGVGLLQVADGALSQVTNLLNRAITLATEASNGTLNTSQGAAANQEYQSILAEINNIGSTTTYNQQAVFGGKTVAIYTGDSSTTGSSVDNIYLRSLSSANVGDTNGKITYSNGQNNVFIDLSNGGTNAATADSLGGTSTTITVNYLTNTTNGLTTNASANISVGTGTNYANTAQGLITAINDAGLGLSATLTTASMAGTAAVSSAIGTGGDTGILISGQGVGAGSVPGKVGTLTLSGGVSNAADTLGGTLTIGQKTITLGAPNTTDTLQNLQTMINAGSYGVKATLSGSVLTLTSSDSSINVSSIGLVDSTSSNVLGTLTIGGSGTATDTLTGSIDIMGSDGVTHNYAIASGINDTLATLASFITGQNIGVTATAAGNVVTFAATSSGSQASLNASDILGLTDGVAGSTLNVASGPGALTLADVPVPMDQMTTSPGTIGTLTIGGNGNSGDTLSGTLNIVGKNGINTAITLSSANNTLAKLATYINGLNIGISASVNSSGNGKVLTLASTSADSMASFSAAGIASVTDGTAGSTLTVANVFTPPVAYYNIGISGVVSDTTTGGGGTNFTAMTTDTNGTSGIATTSYSDGAGVNLSNTDLTTQVDAQAALNQINLAIAAAAALDGYIGGQINMLNSVSSVLTTQKENVISAQNALQATDYATATSNMSKFEILTQTGIAALAQANSIQKEVTKLLQ